MLLWILAVSGLLSGAMGSKAASDCELQKLQPMMKLLNLLVSQKLHAGATSVTAATAAYVALDGRPKCL